MGPAQATVVQGVRDVQTVGNETRRSRDVWPSLLQLEPDAGPITTITMKTRKKSATDPRIEWFEDQLLPRFDSLTAILQVGDVAFSTANPTFYRAGDLVRVNQNEIVLVTATPAAGAATVAITRAYGEIAAAQAAQTSQLHIIGNTNQEGAGARSLLTTVRVPQFNYCQIIRDPFALTKTAKVTKTFAGQDWSEEQMKQLIEHKKHIELSFIMGQRKEDTTGLHPQRTTRGLERSIQSFVLDAGGPLSEAVFDGFNRTAFRYGKKTKLFIYAPIIAQALDGFAKGKMRIIDKEKSYGLSLSSYETSHGTLLLHKHEQMINLDLNDFTGIGGEGLVLDIDDVMMRYMEGRMAIHNENIQANDADLREDEYLSEVGLELHLEARHAKVMNVTG